MGIAKLKARGAKFVSVNPVQDRLFRRRRRMGRHPSRHRRTVRAVAGARTAGRGSHRSGFPGSLHQCAGWLVRRPTTGCSCAMPTASPSLAERAAGEVTLPDATAARYPVFHLLAERYLDGRYAPDVVRGNLRHPRRRRSAASRANWPTSRSTRRSRWTSPGPTPPAAGTRRCSGGRWRCTRCAAFPPTPTASTPAARSICCRCCWARSIRRARGATSRRSRGRSRRGRSPSGKGAKPNSMLPGMALGNPRGPEDLLLEDDGSADAHRQGVSPGMRRCRRTA